MTLPSHSVTITYLEMRERPSLLKPQPPHGLDGRLMLMKTGRMPVGFYRYLYDAVGREYHWYDRKRWDDAKLGAEIWADGKEIFVLYVRGAPAGYFELDFREEPDCELTYFGIIPDFHGLRLGRFFLSSAIARAWDQGIKRLTVHTNTDDHPRALPLYQKLGFVPYAQETAEITPLAPGEGYAP